MKVDHSKSAYTLLVHDARLEDEAEFQCQVGPGKNEKPIRSVARLTVLVPPKFLSINDLPNGSEIEVREAEKVVLLCQALSSKPATILKWYRKNNELMPDASRTTVRREGEKLYSTLSSITLYPKGDTSGSSFTCEALHPALEKPLRTTVGVGVLYPPQHPVIEGYHEGDLIYKGDKLVLTCSSSGGKPPADIVWYKNEEVIRGSFSSLGRDSTNTISINVQSSDNNAVYTCSASNPLTARPLIATVKPSVVFPPKFITIDGPSEVNRGETVTIYCRSDVSNPPAELSWLVDGRAVEPQDTASHPVENGWYSTSNLTAIITRQDMDIKTFSCIAHTSPRHGKVFQTFNVTVLYPPEIPVLSGYEETLKEGDRQSFTCSGQAGNPPAELKWFRGETEVSSVSTVLQSRITSTISFEIEASDNEISVRCEVNNSATPEPLVTEVKLTVLFPPQNVTISVEPLQPREGDTVKLECWSGSSNPPAYIQWWKDGVVLKDYHQSEIIDTVYGGSSTRSRISVPLTSADHQSRFTCEAKNDAFQRSVQEKVTLNVYYTPIFPVSEKVVEVVEGRSGEVNMTAVAYPEVQTYKWSKNGVFVPRWAKGGSPAVTANGAVLYFNHVSRHDSGAYTCVAQNVEGSAGATLILNVLYSASVTNVTPNVEVAEGDTAQLECTADGNPIDENTITWIGEGVTLRASTTDIGRSVLTLNNITRKDGGVVECIANNNVGHPSKRKAQITVLYKPIILKDLLQSKVATGEREYGEVTCIADGNPDVSFVWTFNGSTIHLDATKYSLKQNTQNHWSSTLIIRNINEADYGAYTCIAGNSLGHDFITINLVKRSAPESPQGLEARNISHQSALLVWTPGFDGGLSQTFQLKIQKNQDISSTFVHIPINSSSYLLSGLSQGALYEVSIAAKNVLGKSPFSSLLKFRTKSLPVMDSTISGPASSSSSSVEFLPSWLFAVAVIGGLVVIANCFVCIIYIRRKRYGHPANTGTPVSDEDVSREMMSKKIPPEEHAPFYLSGTSVDMPDDGLDVDSFQKPHSVELHQVSRDSSEDGKPAGRRCDCGERQWNSTLMCGRSLEDEFISSQHEQCPDILKRDSCHCHAAKKNTEVESASNIGAVMYGKKDRSELSSDDYSFRYPIGPPQITLTTFQSELPIRHTIIGPKLETVINGHEEDS